MGGDAVQLERRHRDLAAEHDLRGRAAAILRRCHVANLFLQIRPVFTGVGVVPRLGEQVLGVDTQVQAQGISSPIASGPVSSSMWRCRGLSRSRNVSGLFQSMVNCTSVSDARLRIRNTRASVEETGAKISGLAEVDGPGSDVKAASTTVSVTGTLSRLRSRNVAVCGCMSNLPGM